MREKKTRRPEAMAQVKTKEKEEEEEENARGCDFCAHQLPFRTPDSFVVLAPPTRTPYAPPQRPRHAEYQV